MPAPVAQSAASNVGSTTVVITKPSGVADGDVLVACVSIRAANTSAWSAPDGTWTSLGEISDGDEVTSEVFWKPITNAAGEAASYTFTYGAGGKTSGGIIRVSGADTAAPVDGAIGTGAGEASTTNTITASEVTTSGPDRLLLFFGATRFNTATWTMPTGFDTEWWDVASTGGAASSNSTSMAATDTQASAGGSGTKTATYSGANDAWTAILIAIKEPAAPLATKPTIIRQAVGRAAIH
ncbi:MAG: hypothetical protein ACSLE9_07910 [Burkholderiaceae bacterium]